MPPYEASIVTDRLELIALTAERAEGVLRGAWANGQQLLGPDPGWPDEHDRAFIEHKLTGVRADPAQAQWVRLLVARPPGTAVSAWPHDGPGILVGHAGFHGPPGVNGGAIEDALEVGYTLFPPERGRGLATEAVRALIAWAREAHGIQHFLGSVAPDNAASIAVLTRLDFTHFGEQWDDEDGRELVYELRLAAGAQWEEQPLPPKRWVRRTPPPARRRRARGSE